MRMGVAIAVLGAVLFSTQSACAQEAYPVRPITVIVPYAPGGGTDALARIFTQKLSEILAQPVIVENRAGGSGVVAARHVKGVKPDGYTLLLAGSSTFVSTFTNKNAGYSVDDFTPIAPQIKFSLVVAAGKDFPANNAREFVNYVKANPGKVTFGTTGQGGAVHVLQGLLNLKLGLQLIDVPFKGAGPALIDLIGGHVQLIGDSPNIVSSYAKEGKLKIIGIADESRSAVIPNVPTFGEQGYPSIQLDLYHTYVAPKGTPPEVVKRIYDAFVRTVNDPDVRQKVLEGGYETPVEDLKTIDLKLRAQTERWGQIISELKITTE